MSLSDVYCRKDHEKHGRIKMTIRIRIRTQKEGTVPEKAMAHINRAAAGCPQWEKPAAGNCCETECDIPEKEILPILGELTEKYPLLDLWASYSHEIREDDRSAQWWETKTIKTERHPDGSASLVTDSSIHWF
ncbi:MAG TPA: hypothetical protein DF613_04615 [Lachnospiraceae bacterium]|nr:hypothetical protein [Lachnospiraceae bacterium]